MQTKNTTAVTFSDTWWTSDLHFYHKKIQEFCPETRQGDTLEEMNELIIQNWNKNVKPHDTIWHLGDFSFGTAQQTIDILMRLNGRKRFLRGNHDKQLDNLPKDLGLLESYKPYQHATIGSDKFVLFHFPIESWDRKHYGSYHLHGHMHGDTSNGSVRIIKNRFDVGIDNRPKKDMCPFHHDEVLELLKNRV